MNRRAVIGVGAVTLAVAVMVVAAMTSGPGTGPSASNRPPASGPAGTGDAATADATPRPSIVRPEPGHELFGFLPYWEMNDGIADHLAQTPLTTLALYSVTHTRDGSLNTTQQGYRRITADLGKQLIRDAHDRGVDVQLTYTNFGPARTRRFLEDPAVQDRTIKELVALVRSTNMDGINVDVERLDRDLVPAYGTFVGRLREALRAKEPKAQVSVATQAGRTGAMMAAAAAEAGADRIFLMGYDYHFGQSDVGASSPLDRRDGDPVDLPWSLDLYESLGVPLDRTILGLPLYGMRWRVAGPEIGASRLGDGAIWVPADNPNFLANPPTPPELDPIEVVEFYSVAPTVSPVPGDSRATAGWQAIYVDSPRTLEPKMALADERGFAGVGLWAIGYERGLDGYRDLFQRFRKGKLD